MGFGWTVGGTCCESIGWIVDLKDSSQDECGVTCLWWGEEPLRVQLQHFIWLASLNLPDRYVEDGEMWTCGT